MNTELIEKINELSYTFIKHGLNAELEIVVDNDTFYRIISAYTYHRPWGTDGEFARPLEVPSRPKDFNAFTINAPGGAIKIIPKQKPYYKEYNEDDKYPF